MAEPTLHCLKSIRPMMPKGARIIVDDYGVSYYKCREAVDEFRKGYPQDGPLNWIDESGVWWEVGGL